MLLFSVIFFAACVRLTELAICPLSRHVVCNENYAERRCLCAMSLEESPPPEPSCSHIMNTSTPTSKPFEAISIQFKLDNNSQTQIYFPERQLRQELASAFGHEEKSIVLLRLRCSSEENDGSEITAQLVVIKRNPPVPFMDMDLLDTRTAIGRIRKLGHIAGLEITHVNKLYSVESYTENGRLIIEAVIAGLFMFATSLCGCWIACKQKNTAAYDDDLQKV
ncbi:hypothetical protein DdX_02428 [Ditylenchus destructor]|uniref:Uncharacterized protein n=1 Tax=Ditylenchus destructor TaxID=166010 RepID=A0AAD4NHM7_9BILA|nr:hypothetical protein DdX_02428 [Ditylenchus destructor]